MISSDSERGGGCCSDETGVLRQPSVQRAPHPTDIHAPSKINFPFRPCSMFSSGPLLRESLHDSRESKTRAEREKDQREQTHSADSTHIQMHTKAGKKSYFLLFLQFGERAFLPPISRVPWLITGASWQHRGGMLRWSSPCSLVHLQHGVSGRW